MRMCWTWCLICSTAVSFASAQTLLAQTPEKDAQPLRDRVARLQERLDAAQRQLEQDHATLDELRQQLAVLQAASTSSSSANTAAQVTHLQQAVDDLREQQNMQQAEIAVHDQAKLETQSKYRLRLGGLVLFNAFSNDGAVDRVDLPSIALARTADMAHGSLGASVRQTLLNLDVTGPDLWGAHSYAHLETDFFGGFSTADYNSGGGVLRLRTLDAQLAWPRVAAKVGLSRDILTPSTPTSYASVAVPALIWSGLLWAWIPQASAQIPVSLGGTRQLSFAAAAVDAPDAGAFYTTPGRPASAGERSRYPGVEAHTAFSWRQDASSSVGAGGYFSPHDYGTYGSFDAWAAVADWRLRLVRSLELSGQAYDGVGLAGLGAGTFKDYVVRTFVEADGTQKDYYEGLRDRGGWAQLKFHPLQSIEFNEAIGTDNSTAAQIRDGAVSPIRTYGQLTRTQTFLTNIIYRPRAAIILSGEFRNLHSVAITGPLNSAHIYSLAAGFEF